MTAQIEPNPRAGRELRLPRVRRCFAWLWRHRQAGAALVAYGLLYALALAIRSGNPKVIGGVALAAASAAILGHCLSEVGDVGDR